MLAAFLTLLAAAAIFVHADPNPTDPGPGEVFLQGHTCTIGWDADTTGVWTTMNIDLMTGDNFNMVRLTTVATVDGTNPSKNTFSFKCPKVTPLSPIYFYQFSSPSTSNKTWTGRFTITDSSNNILAPSQSTQPDGQKIPWGTGSLVDGASSSATSSTLGTSSDADGTSTSATSSTTSGSSDSTSPSGTAASSVVIVVVSATPTTAATSAAAPLSVSSILYQSGLALGLAAFGFAIVL